MGRRSSPTFAVLIDVTAPRSLTEDEFKACFAEPMRDVTAEAEAQIDIWPYVDSLDLEALGVPHLNDVRRVYRDGLGRYDQVLIGTGRFNAVLVVVVDLREQAIAGHHLLDMNKAYGASGDHLRVVR
jgi:hypothetical protein